MIEENEIKNSIVEYYQTTDIIKYSDIYDKYEISAIDRRLIETVINFESEGGKFTYDDIGLKVGLSKTAVCVNINKENVQKCLNFLRDILFDNELKNGLRSIKRKLVKRISTMIDENTTTEEFIIDMSKQHLPNENKGGVNVGVQVNNNIDPFNYE